MTAAIVRRTITQPRNPLPTRFATWGDSVGRARAPACSQRRKLELAPAWHVRCSKLGSPLHFGFVFEKGSCRVQYNKTVRDRGGDRLFTHERFGARARLGARLGASQRGGPRLECRQSIRCTSNRG